MRNFKPNFSLGCTRPEQTKLQSKFGGRPWGLAPAKWPKGMALLCQLVHDPPMIDLGGDYVLQLWHWNDPDDFQDPPEYHFHCDFSTLVPRSELGEFLTPAPSNQKLIGEVFIESWEEFDDNMPVEWLTMFFDKSSYGELLEREVGAIQFGGGLGTKFGRPPCWQGTNAIENAPQNCEFIFQTNAYIPIQGQLPNPNLIEKNNLKGLLPNPQGNGFQYVITDFGSDGSAFVFLDKTQDPPIPLWTWSR